MIQIWKEKTLIAIRENISNAEKYCKENNIKDVKLVEVKE